MTTHRIAAIQMSSGTDVARNLRDAGKLIQQAADEDARLLVLPENFALMPHEDTDKLAIQEKLGEGRIQQFLSETAQKHQVWIVGGTLPLESTDPKRPFNASIVYDDKGKQVGCYRKIHLFDAEVTPGIETYSESKTTLHGNEVVVIETPFGRLGLGVCYDVRFPELFRSMMSQGVEIIALPTAFTYTTGKAHWEVLTRARAIENFCYFVGACQTGEHENGRRTYGHSIIISPWGTVMECLLDDPGVICGDISLTEVEKTRKAFAALHY